MAADYEPLVWNDALITGVSEIDDQHRILVNTLNEANAVLAANTTPDFLEQITRDLLSYALYHFETEEQLMQQYGYTEAVAADAEHHHREHRAFSSKVVAVREGLKGGVMISREELLSFLNNWLVNHIQHTDMKLSAFIVARQQGR